MSRRLFQLFCVLGLWSVLGAAGGVWKESSFADFADGSFSDGGANMYVSLRGRVQTINRWDLNGDGYLDLVFANSHPQAEKIDAVLYWGNGKDFDISRSAYIPTNGSQFVIPADVNGDSYPDLLVPNYHDGTHDGMDSYIYLNSGPSQPSRSKSEGWNFYPFGKKFSLPTQAAQHAAAADLNRDGYVDVVFAFSGGLWEYRANPFESYKNPSRIYWGAAEGFNRDRFTKLPTFATSSVAIADLDADGWPDLVLASHEVEGKKDVDSHVYWGSPQGFSAQGRTRLPTRGANMVKGADLNNDGFLDVVFANGTGKASYIYYGGNSGFSVARREELETWDARDCGIADVNRDGFLDILFSCQQKNGNPVTQSYLYFGSVEGFLTENRFEFDTVGAWGVALEDLNQDGWIEAVVSSYQDYAFYDVPSYVYWNSPSGFDLLNRTPLYTHGAVGCSVTDFNRDGHPDLIFANTASRYRGNHHPVSIYWGNSRGHYTRENRQLLPAVDSYGLAAADLNDDGYPELLVGNTYETGHKRQESYVYWGGPEGFSVWRMSGLMGFKTVGLSVADLDRDGSLDVVLGNAAPLGDEDVGSFIYWGSPGGFAVLERTSVPTDKSAIPLLADANRDGHLDIVFGAAHGNRGAVIYWGDGGRNYHLSRRTFIPGSEGSYYPEAADVNRDGWLDLLLARGNSAYVYFGNSRGVYSADRRLELPTVGALSMTAADFNQDGWQDLVVPAYSTGTSRATLSRLFWGRPQGYSHQHMTLLPSDGGTGSLAADFNRDGFLDLLIVCHRRQGDPNQVGAFNDHTTDSFIYWGGPNGFDPDRKASIPTEGAHNDYGVDLGNIYDRSFQFDYISSPYDTGSRVPIRIEWKGVTAHGSRLKFQIRTSKTAEALLTATWKGPRGRNSYYEEPGASLADTKDRWMQYRAVFVSTDGVSYPVLEEVAVYFQR